jgi:hypothetical protein
MTRWARRLAGPALALLLLTGCPAGDRPTGRAGAPARQTAPVWAQAAPAAVVRTAVDLSAALPGVPGTTTAVVATPDGGADVVVTPDDPAGAPRLVVLDRGLTPVASLPVPGLRRAWSVRALPGGAVLLAGELRTGYGLVVVDPASGAQRAAVVAPLGAGVAEGGAVLSADGRTVRLLISVDGGRSELVAVDVASGTVLAERDIAADVGAVSARPLAPYAAWLLPGLRDGVGLLFSGRPDDAATATVPTLLRFGADLTPVEAPGPLTDLATSAAVGAAVGGGEDAVFLTVSRRDGAWLLGLSPERATATALVRLESEVYGWALAVDPWNGWAILPAPGGLTAVNLVTGGSSRVDLGCRLDTTVGTLARGPTGNVVLAAGACEDPRPGTPMLWAVQV